MMKILLAADMSVSYIKRYDSKKVIDVFKNVKPFFDDTDFSIANLECVLYDGDSTPIPKSGPNIKGDPKFVECLKYLNLDVVGLANNHIGDYGDEATISTFNLLNKNGISYIGAGKNIEEAFAPHIFEKDGLKVAIIAVCENEFGIAQSNKIGSAGFNLARVVTAIKSAKKKADKLVLYFHGGNEYNPFPSPEKTELYRHLIDIGADAVIAMHTHCPQGYEIYNGKPIVYSMGNFYFPKTNTKSEFDKSSTWYFGYMSELNITENDIYLEIIPYRFGKINDSIEILFGEKKEKFLSYLNEITQPIFDDKKLKHLFNIWSAISGVVYANNLKYSVNMEKYGTEICCDIKNALSCEAHNELLRNTLNLCYFNKLDMYKGMMEEITKYQYIKI